MFDELQKTSPIPRPLPPMGEAGDEWKIKKQVNGSVLEHAREMRKHPTEAEAFLWYHLNFDQLGVRFRRQHPIKGYILDFYCDKAKLGIEVDGPIHDNPQQREQDQIRTDLLSDEKIYILRFTNEEVLNDVDSVLDRIRSYL